jgi:hypothetical protein
MARTSLVPLLLNLLTFVPDAIGGEMAINISNLFANVWWAWAMCPCMATIFLEQKYRILSLDTSHWTHFPYIDFWDVAALFIFLALIGLCHDTFIYQAWTFLCQAWN